MFDRKKKDFIDLIQHECIKPEKTVVRIRSIQTIFSIKGTFVFTYAIGWNVPRRKQIPDKIKRGNKRRGDTGKCHGRFGRGQAAGGGGWRTWTY